MGFFKDFKNDLSQALNELIQSDDVGEDMEEPIVNTLDEVKDTMDDLTESERMKEWLDEIAMEEEAGSKKSKGTKTRNPKGSKARSDESDTELSGETDTELNGETDTELNGESGTELSDGLFTEPSGEPDTELYGESYTEMSGELDEKLSGEPDIELSGEFDAELSDESDLDLTGWFEDELSEEPVAEQSEAEQLNLFETESANEIWAQQPEEAADMPDERPAPVEAGDAGTEDTAEASPDDIIINADDELAIADDVLAAADEDEAAGQDNQIIDVYVEVTEDMSAEEILIKEGEDMDENIDLELLSALSTDDDSKAEEITDNEEPVKEEAEREESNKEEAKPRISGMANEGEATVISKGTTINGNISSDGSLDIMGTVTGDIECLGKLSITGKVTGNSSAAEIYVNTDRIEGGLNSEGSVKVGLGTVVIGDIVATSGVIAGAVKGEIDINGPVVIDSTAIIKGNIKAKSVQVNNGAVIEGFCSLSYAAVDVDNIFE